MSHVSVVGMVMVTTNEYLREVLTKRSGSPVLDVKTTMLAGMGAGAAASAITTPLDRVKTRLQTQGLSTIPLPSCTLRSVPKTTGRGQRCL